MIAAMLVSLFLIAADQVLKWCAMTYLKPVGFIPIINNVLHLYYLENEGAAFGLFEGNVYILVVVTAVLLAILLIAIIGRFIRHPMVVWALSLIVAGGVGNLIDRIFRGFVVDYVYFVPIDFPVFNLADICVVTGTALIIIYILFVEPRERRKKHIFIR